MAYEHDRSRWARYQSGNNGIDKLPERIFFQLKRYFHPGQDIRIEKGSQ